MELPSDVNQIIKKYSLPLTRADWRKGSYMMREYEDTYYGLYCKLNKREFKTYLLHCLLDSRKDFLGWAIAMEMKDLLFHGSLNGSVNELLFRVNTLI